eukprot:GFUD01025220.1.p1 GENE.GFUD01025220.1~~GFUD01025220.1.p1  ORF type:complete len:833 (-),score=159.21 GFUD01025220.1:143-2641(-)
MANASLKNFKLEDFTNNSDEADSSEDEQETKSEANEPPPSSVDVKTENDNEAKPFDLSQIVKTELIYNQDDEDSDDKDKDQDWLISKAYQCPFCKASFNKANNMKSHIKRIHTTYKPEECFCEPCDKHFKNPDCLKSHVKEFHTPGVDRIPQLCTHCGKSFNKKSNLKVHILNSHTKYDPVDCICSQCGKMFKNPLSMKRHVETFHDEERKAEMVVVCPDCGKQFNKRTNLKIHMECVHTTYEPGQFICELCSKELKNPHSLKSHIREVHTLKDEGKDLVMHKCDECEKEFKKKKDLRGHKYAAHKIDVKMCEFCFNEYKNQTALKQHLRLVHGPEQQVSCEICFKTFKNITRLKHHHLDVHKIENSACPDCGKSFKNKFLMKKHLRYLHRGPNGSPRLKPPKSGFPKEETSFAHSILETKPRKPKKTKLDISTSVKALMNPGSFSRSMLESSDEGCKVDSSNDRSVPNSSQVVKSEFEQKPSESTVQTSSHSVEPIANHEAGERSSWNPGLTERLAPQTNDKPASNYNHSGRSEIAEQRSDERSEISEQRSDGRCSLNNMQGQIGSQIVQHPNPKYLWKQYQVERSVPMQEHKQIEVSHLKPNHYDRSESDSRVTERQDMNHQQGFGSAMVQNTNERSHWNNIQMERTQETKQVDRAALNLSHCERSKPELKTSERSSYNEAQGFGSMAHQSSSADKSMWTQNQSGRGSVDYNQANNAILDYRYRERSLMDHNPMAYFNQMQNESLGLNLIHNERSMMHHDPNRRSVVDQMQTERSMLDHLQNARSVFEQMQMQNGRSALDQLLNSRQGFESMQHMQNGRSLWDQAGQNRR